MSLKEGDIVVVKRNGLLAEVNYIWEPDTETPYYSYDIRYFAVQLINTGWDDETLDEGEIVLEKLWDSKLYKVLG